MAKKEVKKFDRQAIMNSIATKYGKEIMADPLEKIYGMPTGFLALDRAIGTIGGGLPIGRITEIFGENSTGKSLLGLMLLAEAQRQGGLCILIDSERAYNSTWAMTVGLNVHDPNFFLMRPDTLEDAYSLVEEVSTSLRATDPEIPIVIVIDSVAAFLTDAEDEEGMDGKVAVAGAARVNSRRMRFLLSVIDKNKVALLLVNQVRSNIGSYVKDIVTSGGKAIGFYSSLRIEARVNKKIVEGKDKEIVGTQGDMYIIKSRTCRPFIKVPIELYHDMNKGIVLTSGLFDVLLEEGKFTPKLTQDGKVHAGYFLLEGYEDAFTSNTFSAFLEAHPEALQAIKEGKI